MSLLDENNSFLLIIDIQEKLINAAYNKEVLQKNASILASAANILHIPVIITEQYPRGLGGTVNTINYRSAKIFEKNTFSALDNEDINIAVESLGRKQAILFGIETHICVSQTSAALVDSGYDVCVVANACGSRNEFEHNYGLERIKQNGGEIITTEIALFELLKSSKHPNFKEIQSLIK